MNRKGRRMQRESRGNVRWSVEGKEGEKRGKRRKRDGTWSAEYSNC